MADLQVAEGQRDPRVTPIVGDELEDAESWVGVDEVSDAWVLYVRLWRPRLGSKAPLRRAVRGTTPTAWRALMRDARVIKIAVAIGPQEEQR